MKDGTLTLFKPDLTHVRSIEAPAVQGIGPVIDITWFTNTEFFIGYVTEDNIPSKFHLLVISSNLKDLFILFFMDWGFLFSF